MAIAFDTFDRANAASLGGSWTSGSGNWSISSNVAIATNTSLDANAIWSALSSITDQFSEAALTVTGGVVNGDQGVGVLVRGDGASSQTMYRLIVDHAATGNVSLNRFNAGAQTVLARFTQAWTDGDRWRLEIVGFVLTIKLNGVVVGTYDDSGSGSKLSSGGPGIVYSSTESVPTWNDWVGGDLKLDYVNTTTGSTTSQNPALAAFPVAIGDSIVVGAEWVGTGTNITSVTDGDGNTYVQVPGARGQDAGTGDVQDVWVCLSALKSNQALVITLHFNNSSGTFMRQIANQYSPPAGKSLVIDGVSQATHFASSTTWSLSTITPVGAQGVIFGMGSGDSGVTYTAGSGFTLRTPEVASDTQSEDRLFTTNPGAVTPSISVTVATPGIFVAVGLSTGGVVAPVFAYDVDDPILLYQPGAGGWQGVIVPPDVTTPATTPVASDPTVGFPIEANQGVVSDPTVGEPVEAPGGLATTASDPVEAQQGISAPGSADPVEENQGVATTDTDPIEANQGVAATGSEPVEAPGGVRQTGSEPVESQQGVVAPGAADPIEATQGVASSDAEVIEAPGGIASTSQDPVEANQGGIASTTGDPIEALQGVRSQAGTVATDNFNRANGGLGANWSSIGNALAIVGNQVTTSAGNSLCGSVWNANSFGADQFSQFTVVNTPISGDWVGAYVRAVSGGSQGYLVIYFNNSGSYELDIYKMTSLGVFSLLNAHGLAGPLNIGDLVSLEAIGSTLNAKVNGVTLNTISDSSYPSGGAPGLGVFSPTSVSLLDNFVGGDFGGWAIEAQQGVSTTTAAVIEALGGVASADDFPIEASGLVAVIATGILPIEALQGISTTAADPLEAQQGIATSVVDAVEATGGVASTSSDPIEAPGGIAATGSLPIEAQQTIRSLSADAIESLQGIVASGVLPIEAPQGVVTLDADALEALGGIASSGVLPIEAIGLAVVTATGSFPIEALGGVASPGAEQVESQAPVATTAADPIEAAQGVRSTVSVPIEAGGGVAASALFPIEALGGVLATGGEPIESLAIIAATTASGPTEAPQGVRSTDALVLEAAAGIAAQAGLPLDALHAVVAIVVLPIEAQGQPVTLIFGRFVSTLRRAPMALSKLMHDRAFTTLVVVRADSQITRAPEAESDISRPPEADTTTERSS